MFSRVGVTEPRTDPKALLPSFFPHVSATRRFFLSFVCRDIYITWVLKCVLYAASSFIHSNCIQIYLKSSPKALRIFASASSVRGLSSRINLCTPRAHQGKDQINWLFLLTKHFSERDIKMIIWHKSSVSFLFLHPFYGRKNKGIL